MKRFSGCLMVVLLLASCGKNESVPSEKKLHHSSPKKQSEEPLSEFENAEWRRKDSIAMEYIHMANWYAYRGHHDKALILYKHVCTLEHSIPDVCHYTANLCNSTNESSRRKAYLWQEIERAHYFIDKDHPRSHEFQVALLHSFYELNEQDSLAFYAKKYNHNLNYVKNVAEAELNHFGMVKM